MGTTVNAASGSKALVWTGNVLSGLAILFLLFDTVIKVVQAAPAVESTVQLGYPAEYVVVLGLAQLICLVLYIYPRTAVLGAILLTGWFGGAMAAHVRAGSPMFSVIFPILIGLMVWGGLYGRDARLRALLPFRK
ncbi:MAG: DoxX family protein [Roseiflexaceae bacterium]|nr:DoxX family protein [Roseiflexaceae bacterium]